MSIAPDPFREERSAPPAEPAHLFALPPVDDEPDDVGEDLEADGPPAPRLVGPWRAWDASRGGLGPLHVRQDRPDGSKAVTWQTADGSSGLGEHRLEDLVYVASPDGIPWADGVEIVVTEGEKAAQAAAATGAAAMGTVCGASARPGPAVVALLARYRVTLSPDSDDVGRRHMERIAADLERAGLPELRMIDTPDGSPEHWDLADVDVATRRALIASARRLEMFGPSRYPVVPARVDDEDEVPAWIVAPPSTEPVDIHSGGGTSPRAGMNFRTARDLFADVPAETSWRLFGVPDGSIAELDGPPKRAGKTRFAAHAIRAVLDGTPFLGRPTRPGPVVLLSEQPVASLRASLAPAGLVERGDLWILTYGEAIGRPWREVARDAVDLCIVTGAGLLVVDTLPQWAGLRGDAENDAGAALQALEPLQRAAAAGLAVLVVRHDRKGSGEVGDSARGSSAFGGAVDVIMQLRRGGPDERQTIRYLSTLSRFPELPTELVIDLREDGYVELGDAAGYARAEGKLKVLAAISDRELRRSEIEEATGVSGERLTDILADLVATGYLVRAGRGVKGDPQRFARTVSIRSGGPPTTWGPPDGMELTASVPATTAPAGVDCRDYAAHQSNHRQVDGRWVCDACSPEDIP